MKKIFDKKEVKPNNETWNWKQKQLANIQQAAENSIRENGGLPFTRLNPTGKSEFKLVGEKPEEVVGKYGKQAVWKVEIDGKLWKLSTNIKDDKGRFTGIYNQMLRAFEEGQTVPVEAWKESFTMKTGATAERWRIKTKK